ncbi:ABC transporter ATP-binding protein [Methylobacterium tarhaniae]|uniref:ABC transporter ATP-binding protein n=1 Tax=Methylobacterium tarhaniae TaxID=1187852 RepID=A0A0J6SQS3_9HYPH|nr:ABC transporter ATP-binding protein [Methylobacterium tarhaniae]KMO35962.1 ABC transporter ATP-binding protein [Methylobacterium tarhaniae]
MLEVRGLSTAYQGLLAIQGVSIEVDTGEIVVVAGANGAGKSTLLKSISGMERPRSGEVVFDGARIDGLPGHAITARGIAYVPENKRLFPRLSVSDNLRLGSYLHRKEADREAPLERVFTLFPRLKERLPQRAGTLSGGEQQMLAIGRALMTRPRLLMLDEPSLGLAPLIVAEVMRTVARLRDEGVAILLVEQNARAALQIADHGYVLDGGSVVLQGDSRTLQGDARVVETYLGTLAVDDAPPSRAASGR